MSSEDKRNDARVTINKEFESFDAFVHEYVTNISRTGVFIKSTTPLAGIAADAAEAPVVATLRERGLLVEAGRIVHRYPTCWRCKTPLLFRVVDDWFISAQEVRQPLFGANATVEWTPSF